MRVRPLGKQYLKRNFVTHRERIVMQINGNVIRRRVEKNEKKTGFMTD